VSWSATCMMGGSWNFIHSPMSNAFPFAVGRTNSPWYNVKSSPGKVSFGVGSRILLQGPRNLMRKAIRPLIWDTSF
jgi:hypothetical protein